MRIRFLSGNQKGQIVDMAGADLLLSNGLAELAPPIETPAADPESSPIPVAVSTSASADVSAITETVPAPAPARVRRRPSTTAKRVKRR